MRDFRIHFQICIIRSDINIGNKCMHKYWLIEYREIVYGVYFCCCYLYLMNSRIHSIYKDTHTQTHTFNLTDIFNFGSRLKSLNIAWHKEFDEDTFYIHTTDYNIHDNIMNHFRSDFCSCPCAGEEVGRYQRVHPSHTCTTISLFHRRFYLAYIYTYI